MGFIISIKSAHVRLPPGKINVKQVNAEKWTILVGSYPQRFLDSTHIAHTQRQIIGLSGVCDSTKKNGIQKRGVWQGTT